MNDHILCASCAGLHYITSAEESYQQARFWYMQDMLLQNSSKTDKLNLTKGNIFAFATVIVSYEEKRTHWEFVQTNNASVIDKGKFRVRKTSESWHSANTNEADNKSKPLPKQYPIDLNENICSLFYFFFTFLSLLFILHILFPSHFYIICSRLEVLKF